MLSGLALLLPSLVLLIVASAIGSMALLILATALSGISAALGYCGSLEVINQISPAEKRSEVVSSYLIACFAGNSVPVVGIGLISQSRKFHDGPPDLRGCDWRVRSRRSRDRGEVCAQAIDKVIGDTFLQPGPS